MSSIEPELHVLYAIGNAMVREYPYPHIYVENVFPAGFYAELRRNLPPQGVLRTLGELGRVHGDGYPARGVLPLSPAKLAVLDAPQRSFWEGLAKWMLTTRFLQSMVAKFGPYLAHRFGDVRKVRYGHEALIVRDRSTYSLGPHTDTQSKVLSFLFYLPADASKSHLGTSIYVPRDPDFLCEGGPHHDFALFQRMLTAPYVPNALFAFMKTPNSFHGVEPIEEPEVQRDLLLYDVRIELPEQKPAPVAAPGVKFTF